MGLGHALAQGFAALLLGYLVFIFVQKVCTKSLELFIDWAFLYHLICIV